MASTKPKIYQKVKFTFDDAVLEVTGPTKGTEGVIKTIAFVASAMPLDRCEQLAEEIAKVITKKKTRKEAQQ